MKTKALISCAVTAQLICVFVFAYAKSRFYKSGSYYLIMINFIIRSKLHLKNVKIQILQCEGILVLSNEFVQNVLLSKSVNFSS